MPEPLDNIPDLLARLRRVVRRQYGMTVLRVKLILQEDERHPILLPCPPMVEAEGPADRQPRGGPAHA